MRQTTKASRPKMRHKAFTYNTQLKWGGNRAGILKSEGKPELRVASPPEFKGEEGVWTPEDLFVASVDICTMTTFAAFSERLKLPIVSYESRADGVLEFVDGAYRFTKIVLQPTIIVETASAIEQTEKTIHDAHKSCLVANSIRAVVEIEPRIESVDSN